MFDNVFAFVHCHRILVVSIVEIEVEMGLISCGACGVGLFARVEEIRPDSRTDFTPGLATRFRRPLVEDHHPTRDMEWWNVSMRACQHGQPVCSCGGATATPKVSTGIYRPCL